MVITQVLTFTQGVSEWTDTTTTLPQSNIRHHRHPRDKKKVMKITRFKNNVLAFCYIIHSWFWKSPVTTDRRFTLMSWLQLTVNGIQETVQACRYMTHVTGVPSCNPIPPFRSCILSSHFRWSHKCAEKQGKEIKKKERIFQAGLLSLGLSS